jgi:hypothetical protein
MEKNQNKYDKDTCFYCNFNISDNNDVSYEETDNSHEDDNIDNNIDNNIDDNIDDDIDDKSQINFFENNPKMKMLSILMKFMSLTQKIQRKIPKSK